MRLLKVSTLAVLACALALVAVADEKGRGGVEIRLGGEKKVEGGDLRIAFERVAEDSRCPEGARCIRQGNARVRLVARNRRDECVEFDLNTSEGPSEYGFGEYTISLTDLLPRPAVKREIKRGDYRVALVVSKKKQ